MRRSILLAIATSEIYFLRSVRPARNATRYGTGSLPSALSTVPPAVKTCVTQSGLAVLFEGRAAFAAADVDLDAGVGHPLELRHESPRAFFEPRVFEHAEHAVVKRDGAVSASRTRRSPARTARSSSGRCRTADRRA